MSPEMKTRRSLKKRAEINKVDCFGVVAEFNPFHEGHAYFIDKAREMTGCSICAAAMSGDFTQRGEPAIFDKWERAEAAVEHGVDIVAEIPQVFACSSASFFAKGGVGVLAGLGICDCLAFGSESGDIEKLNECAGYLEEHDEEINKAAADLAKGGMSYPKAREAAAGSAGIIVPEDPNDILAIEYLRQDLRGMSAVAVKRHGTGHNETASVIRKEIEDNDPDFFAGEQRRLFDLISYRIIQEDADELERLASAGGGLGYKLKKEIRYVRSVEELIDRVKSKVYTRTRIQRLLTDILLGIHKSDLTEPGYIRILAMSGRGAEALKTARKKDLCTLPVISNLTKESDMLNDSQKNMISFDIMAGDVYNIIKHYDLYDHSDFVKSPYIKA